MTSYLVGGSVQLGELLHLVCPGAARVEAGVELVDGDGPHLHLHVGDVRGGAVLVPRHEGDDGGPGAAQVPGPEHDAAVLGRDVGLGLQPGSQATPGSPGRALDVILEEQPLV